VGKSLRDHYLRIDARSLGLFRLAFGVVLLSDLFRRYRYLQEFYSNEGVLPNHNHLFNLHDTAHVWSFFHAFSFPGESLVAFAFILFVYLAFLVGYKTRAFHALALVSLVSLTGRNILLENAGNYAAIALAAFTLFLPLGSRFSVDSVMASMAAREEKGPAALNDRAPPSRALIEAERLPGFSPVSLAAFAVLAQIVSIYLVTAIQQRGAWRDGTALHYALNTQRWVSGLGASFRSLSPTLLSAWTRLLYLTGWAVPALVILPVGFRATRGAAAALMVVHALTLGLLFTFGLYAFTLLAAAALLIPQESWDRIELVRVPSRMRTVLYDADCGVCLWLARLLKRLDIRGHLTFQDNASLDELLVGGETGAVTRAAMPREITPELTQGTMITVDPRGRIATRARGLAEVVGALPLGWTVAWLLKVPVLQQIANALYDQLAKHRRAVSVSLGMAACGLTPPPEEAEAQVKEAEAELAASGQGATYRHNATTAAQTKEAEFAATDGVEIAPATRAIRLVRAGLRDALVAVVLVAMIVQTSQANALPWKLPQGPFLLGVAAWPRMLARWDVLTPEPPRTDEFMVIDGQTRGGAPIDPITGHPPQLDPGAMRGTGTGQLWGDYTTRLHEKEWVDFQRAFRDYLLKGGPSLQDKAGDDALAGYDAYWIKQAIPAPGEARTDEITREKVFSYARGGRFTLDKLAPANAIRR
jgi:predicted DCC family thiol-disulfide oxidoreductase YuxK